MAMDDDLSPIFPLELERIIFELAVGEIVSDLPPKRCALNFQLTAKRVRSWVRPLIYSVFKGTNTQVLFPDFETHQELKLEEIGPFIKHCIYDVAKYSHTHLLQVLSYSPAVEDLAIFCDITELCRLYPSISSFKNLKRLFAGLEGLTCEQIRDAPIFQNLSHLYLMGMPSRDALVELKSLTHFGTNDSMGLIPSSSQSSPPPDIKSILETIFADDGLPRIQVVKIYCYDTEDNYDHPTVKDPRVVLMTGSLHLYGEALSDWIDGANGRMDSWELASRIVQARKYGYIDAINVPRGFLHPSSFKYKEQLNLDGQLWWEGLPFVAHT